MNLPPRVFIDTSFFIALLNSADASHPRAVALQAELKQQRTRKITSEFVLVELGDGLARLRYRHLAVNLIRLIRQDVSIDVVPSSAELFERAFALYAQRQDKEWGLTDCSSFVIMEQLGLAHALTADHHFRQAGIEALLLTP